MEDELLLKKDLTPNLEENLMTPRFQRMSSLGLGAKALTRSIEDSVIRIRNIDIKKYTPLDLRSYINSDNPHLNDEFDLIMFHSKIE